jgi:hypothetical protein
MAQHTVMAARPLSLQWPGFYWHPVRSIKAMKKESSAAETGKGKIWLQPLTADVLSVVSNIRSVCRMLIYSTAAPSMNTTAQKPTAPLKCPLTMNGIRQTSTVLHTML